MLPPSIPTSFVPRSAGAAKRRFDFDLTGALGFLAYILLAVVFALAIGVFSYERILTNNKNVKQATLDKATAAIDSATVKNFVRLRNRLDAGYSLIENHVAFSNFFALFETLIPVTVRFTSLHLALNDTKAVRLDGSGVAKSFNALAVASAAFAADGRIKDAIFSNIVVSSKDGSVSFALTAMLDPKLIAFSPTASAVPVSKLPQESASTTPTL